MSSQSSSHDVDDQGRTGNIKTLYDPRSAGRERAGSEIDIIAVHGEQGHWRHSWMSHANNFPFFWLEDALPIYFPQARVVSCTHGGVGEDVLGNLLLDLIDDRSKNRRSQVPMVIIAHSLGGILVKLLFIGSSPSRNSMPEARLLHSNIKGLVFFGVPNQGVADLTFRNLLRQGEMIRQISRWLAPTFSPKFGNVSDFYDLIPSINADFIASGGNQIPTVCFYEGRPTVIGFLSFTITPKEQAILPWAENRSIDANHLELIKFSDAENPSLQRVVGSMTRLMLKAREWTGITLPNRESTGYEPTRGPRILSLDGGGVKGLFSVLILEALMEAVRQIDTPNVPDLPKPCDYFDLICGTSTGGLMAIMLGRLRMDTQVCKRAYCDMSREIFDRSFWRYTFTWWDAFWGNPWYDGKKLEKAIKAVVSQELSVQEQRNLQERGIAVEDAPLRPYLESSERCFVCALPDSGEVHRLKSYTSRRNPTSTTCTIWEAGRATSAAPLYFPPITISGCRYFDGGIGCNNPILEAVREAHDEHPTRYPAAIVSIGTGSVEPLAPTGGLTTVMASLAGRVTDTERGDREFLAIFPGLRDAYFRFQEGSRLGSIDLAAWERLDEIEQIAQAYLRSDRGREDIQRCAERLARRNAPE